jgi:hypothetical protein
LNRSRIFRLSLLVLAVVIGLLSTICIYSAIQLHLLKNHGVHASPADAMYSVVFKDYHGVKKIEVGHMGREVFDHLCLVQVYVWAEERADGRDFDHGDYDNQEGFFVRTRKGWAFVPQERHPQVIALGQWLLGLII